VLQGLPLLPNVGSFAAAKLSVRQLHVWYWMPFTVISVLLSVACSYPETSLVWTEALCCGWARVI